MIFSQPGQPSSAIFSAYFSEPLPQQLRQAANSMSWNDFLTTFNPPSGRLRLQSWDESCTSSRQCSYEATLLVNNSMTTVKTTALGPIAAATSVLYHIGFPLEIRSFHQQHLDARTATFVQCEHQGTHHWAVGIAPQNTRSALESLVAAANLLHS
ncbi:MAG: alpha-isopropylmalate synthase regulatory domain-containing protein [Mycobacteriaceae bacterium]